MSRGAPLIEPKLSLRAKDGSIAEFVDKATSPELLIGLKDSILIGVIEGSHFVLGLGILCSVFDLL